MSFYKILSELFVIPSIKTSSEKTLTTKTNIFTDILNNISKLFKIPTIENNKNQIKSENQIKSINRLININDNYGVWDTIPDNLYIIGDIHGDFFALKQALELTECIIFNDTSNLDMIKWNGTELILEDGCKYFYNKFSWNVNKRNCMIVFSGDLIDRCRNVNINGCINTINDEDCDFLILKFLFELDSKARVYNNRIVIILGNHEIMNLKNYKNYISKKGNQNINRLENIKELIINNINNIYGLIRINKYIIVHGGINYSYFINKNTEWEIELQDASLESVVMFNKILRSNILSKNIILSNGDDNPFWDRTLGHGNCSYISDENILKIQDSTILDKLEIIVAHCPQFISTNNNINYIHCSNKKIWRIDVGMSRSFDTYNYHELYNNLIKLNQYINQLDNVDPLVVIDPLVGMDPLVIIDPLVFYVNKNSIYRKVSILKINNNNNLISETPLIGKLSLEYFFENVFQNNKHLLFYYLLQDIEIYLEDMNMYDDNKINLINSIKKKLFSFINKK